MIRFADVRDSEKIARIHYNNILRTYRDVYPDSFFERISIEKYIEATSIYLQRINFRTIVSVDPHEEIQGFASVGLFHYKRNGLLDYLHVDSKWENRGIGTRLFLAACNILYSEKINKMEISCVEGNNKAKNYYKKFGATYVGPYVYTECGEPRFSNRLLIDNLSKFKIITKLSLGLNDEYKKLEEYLINDFCVWGSGEYFRYFIENVGEKYVPLFILDNDKSLHGLTANGVRVIEPHKTNVPIIITCAKYCEVEKQIAELGCKNSIRFFPWHKYFQG